MEPVSLKAYAKINISLDVISKRSDGYHNVKMIMQSIDLHDKITIEEANEGIKIECNFPWVPTGNKNTVYKAAEMLLSAYNIKKGIKISMRKCIPVGAGLAGGSSDAATVLKGINGLFNLGLDENELMKFGERVGADVPYCIRGETMLAEGIGEILTELEHFPKTAIVLVKPKISVSTKWAYKNLEIDKLSKRPDTELLVKAIKEQDVNKIAKNMVNVFEEVTIKKYQVIDDIKKKLLDLGAMGSMMSGSGPTVFGIFESDISAEKAFAEISRNNWECHLTHTI